MLVEFTASSGLRHIGAGRCSPAFGVHNGLNHATMPRTMRLLTPFPLTAGLLAALSLAGCGGGSSSSVVLPEETITVGTRQAAAAATANGNPACAASLLGSYYWEIGDATGVLGSGSVGSNAPTATTPMSIASASKWVYAAYVVQRVGVRPADVPYLNFTSGYSMFFLPLCQATDTVAQCLEGNDGRNPDTIGKFYYDSGHMQQHASAVMGLGPLAALPLSAEIADVIGDFEFVYSQPQLAGGLVGSAAGYGAFLRRSLRGELAIGAALGRDKVCTNPTVCSDAVASPTPDNERWNYSLGHWVEDDPVVGDHAFSSPGAFGFYPWIDASKTYYGVLARKSDVTEAGAGFRSAACGRLIRQAWMTGEQVTTLTPTPAR
jgi:hypothetical protein